MLWVDDTGRLVTLRWFRPLGWIALLLLIAAVGTSVFSLLLYRQTDAESRVLQQHINDLQEQISTMRQEREGLSTRLAVAETRIQKLSETKPTVPPPDAPAQQPVSEVPGAESGAETEPVREEAPTVSAPLIPSRVVAVEDYSVSRKPGQNILDFNFKLVNVDEKPGPVSGYSFVLLKTDSEESKNWLSLPHASLVDGRPTPVEKGRAFSIARFKTVSFSAVIERNVDLFTSTTILVFESEGELLFEKDYPTPWTREAETIGEG
jgi:hypothetical protein